jgi:hypothetical protein
VVASSNLAGGTAQQETLFSVSWVGLNGSHKEYLPLAEGGSQRQAIYFRAFLEKKQWRYSRDFLIPFFKE